MPRFLATVGEATEVPRRSPGRGPPYWKSSVLHLYEQGGHGFGMYPKETASTGWFNAFVSWLTMHGMLKPKA